MAQWWERWPTRARFQPGAICWLSLLFVLDLLRWFFSGFSGFPLSIKTNISKFKFEEDRGRAWKPAKADVASSLNICFNYFYEIRHFSLVILSVKGTKCTLPTPTADNLLTFYCLCLWALSFRVRQKLGSLSNDADCDPEDNAYEKVNLYFTLEFRNCLDLFRAPIDSRSCSN